MDMGILMASPTNWTQVTNLGLPMDWFKVLNIRNKSVIGSPKDKIRRYSLTLVLKASGTWVHSKSKPGEFKRETPIPVVAKSK
jgi:hypothetical protein